MSIVRHGCNTVQNNSSTAAVLYRSFCPAPEFVVVLVERTTVFLGVRSIGCVIQCYTNSNVEARNVTGFSQGKKHEFDDFESKEVVAQTFLTFLLPISITPMPMETKDDAPEGMDIIMKAQHDDDDPLPMEDAQEQTYDDEHAKWQIVVLEFVNSKLFAGAMILLTIYALFGDDIRLSASEKPDDDIFFTISIIALIFFTLEFVLNMLAKPG